MVNNKPIKLAVTGLLRRGNVSISICRESGSQRTEVFNKALSLRGNSNRRTVGGTKLLRACCSLTLPVNMGVTSGGNGVLSAGGMGPRGQFSGPRVGEGSLETVLLGDLRGSAIV